MISTRTIERIPLPRKLETACQAIAVLEAIMMPDEWELRHYSYDPKWARGERVFSMRNGCGDYYFIWFTAAGAVLRGFAHESAMSPWGRGGKPWPGLFDGLPKDLANAAREPAFGGNDVTFVAWCTQRAPHWSIGSVTFPPKVSDPDGSEFLLFALDGNPATYCQWAREYYERDIPLGVVKQVFGHEPLTEELVARINPEALPSVMAAAEAVGYRAAKSALS